MTRKRTWGKPALIVLVRTNAEENVLAGCKAEPWGYSPNDANLMCESFPGAPPCIACEDGPSS